MKKINDKQNIFGDNIAFVENWDFSTANMSEENKGNISKVCNNYRTKKYKTKYQTCGGFKWKFKD